ncbi:MAG: DUF6125 family protein [Syntrophorhabdaceae bacterium]|nr:DUF6125 family protein [Syntrophorhabdaceae bacterium]MDD5245378.1 DUF6125 family protein [Syntrophorhabdaceae bacterium]
MSGWSNVDEYQKLSKEQLIDLVKMYGRFALTLDGLWFLGVERMDGIDRAIEVDEGVWGEFGKGEAKILKKFLSIDRVSTLEGICRAYLLTSVFSNLGGRAEVRDGRCYLSVTDCHPQKARVKKGMGEFPCKTVGIRYFDGFFKELNPGIRYKCIVCPPDKHPEKLWCQWEVWIDEETTKLYE